MQEEDRVVILRFGHDWDAQCMQMDEVRHTAVRNTNSSIILREPTVRTRSDRGWWLQILASVSEQIKNFAVIYLVDTSEVPDFNTMYELYDPCTTMFFFRNKVSRGWSFASMLAVEKLAE